MQVVTKPWTSDACLAWSPGQQTCAHATLGSVVIITLTRCARTRLPAPTHHQPAALAADSARALDPSPQRWSAERASRMVMMHTCCFCTAAAAAPSAALQPNACDRAPACCGGCSAMLPYRSPGQRGCVEGACCWVVDVMVVCVCVCVGGGER